MKNKKIKKFPDVIQVTNTTSGQVSYYNSNHVLYISPCTDKVFYLKLIDGTDNCGTLNLEDFDIETDQHEAIGTYVKSKLDLDAPKSEFDEPKEGTSNG